MEEPQDYQFRRYRARRRFSGQSTLTGGVVGVVIILVGTGMLLDTLGVLPGRDIWEFLPLILVAFGVLKIIESKNRPGGLIFGGVLAVGGTLWLLNNLQLIRLNERVIFPLILIGAGAGMLAKVLHPRPLTPEGMPIETNSNFSQLAIFGGSRRAIDSPEFSGGDALSIFGGVDLDLRRAKMATTRAAIDANAIFGGVEIKVPVGWSVSMQGMGIFGGFEDKTLHPDNREGAPELVVTGYSIFGGVTISN
jgi:predicted membrane protein